MDPVVRMVKVNALQYNANRDPQAYRRCVGEPFRIEALIAGTGESRCRLLDERDEPLASAKVHAPGVFAAELTFTHSGSRLVTLEVDGAGGRYTQHLRLDVLEHAWVG